MVSPAPRDVVVAHTPQRHKQYAAWSFRLFLLNVLLALAHLGTASYVSTVPFKYPLVVTDTRLRNEALLNKTCWFEYAPASGRGCRTAAHTETGNFSKVPAACASVVSYKSRTAEKPGYLSAYHLVRVASSADPNASGRAASKAILITVCVLTTLAHVLYAVTFHYIRRTPARAELCARQGGLAARWVEYSLTAPLMSFYVANTSMVFDFNALLAISLGTFSLMYYGAVIERLVGLQQTALALFLLWVAAMPLFVLTCLPPIRALFLDVFKLSCRTWQTSSSRTHCDDRTCFGQQVPIAMFVAVMLLLFCVFPLILLAKMYAVSGFAARVRNTPGCAVSTYVCLHVLGFIVFCLLGPMVACGQWLDCVWPFRTPRGSEETLRGVDDPDLLVRVFFWGECLYALASATSKLFLAYFFTRMLSSRAG